MASSDSVEPEPEQSVKDFASLDPRLQLGYPHMAEAASLAFKAGLDARRKERARQKAEEEKEREDVGQEGGDHDGMKDGVDGVA